MECEFCGEDRETRTIVAWEDGGKRMVWIGVLCDECRERANNGWANEMVAAMKKREGYDGP